MWAEATPPSWGPAESAEGQAWSAKMAEFDGYVFVVSEYNHSITGALKNALDYLAPEVNNKAAGFVSYGSAGGARAVEHLRGILSEMQVAHVRNAVLMSLFTDFENFSIFTPTEPSAASVAADAGPAGDLDQGDGGRPRRPVLPRHGQRLTHPGLEPGPHLADGAAPPGAAPSAAASTGAHLVTHLDHTSHPSAPPGPTRSTPTSPPPRATSRWAPSPSSSATPSATPPASLPGRVVVVNKVKHWSPSARVVVLRATTDDGGSALFRPCDLRPA